MVVVLTVMRVRLFALDVMLGECAGAGVWDVEVWLG